MHSFELLPTIEDEDSSPQIKLYKRRWAMILIFSLVTMSNALLWITYGPIAFLVSKLYDVNLFAVNLLSLVYLIVYIPGIFAGSWLIDSKGLRFGLMCGSILNAIGSWIRCAAISPSTFAFAVIGQLFASAAQTFVLGVPPKIAANWFGENERTIATSIGTLFNQLGVAVGFIMAPLVVQDEHDIIKLLIVQAVIATVSCVLIIIFFKSEPEQPPSVSTAAKPTNPQQFNSSLRTLFKNKDFIFLTVSFGISTGVFIAITSLMDQLLYSYNYSDEAAGILGFTLVVFGIIGAAIVGVVADKTKRQKLILLIMFWGTLITTVGFIACIATNNIIVLWCWCVFLGIFITGIIPVSMEAAVDCTYPIPEAISVGLVTMSSQLFGIIFIVFMSIMQAINRDFLIPAAWILVLFIGAACILMMLYKGVSKRKELEENSLNKY